MISLSTIVPTENNVLIIKEEKSSIMNRADARVSKVKTIDGNTFVKKIGYSETDRILLINAKLNEINSEILWKFFFDEIVLNVSTLFGFFLGSIEFVKINNGNAQIKISILERTIDPDVVWTVFFTNGTDEIEKDDTIIGVDTDSKGIVDDIIVTGGDWIDGNAKGELHVKDTSGTFKREEIYVFKNQVGIEDITNDINPVFTWIDHGLSEGNYVRISGISQSNWSGFNKKWKVNTAGADTFTLDLAYDTTTWNPYDAFTDQGSIVPLAMANEYSKEELKLQLLSLQKTKLKYEGFLDTPNPEYIAYCADFSDELTGEVGTIELVGDPDKFLQIKSGYNGEAVYNTERDGQLVYTTGLTPACDYYNYAIKPGWQKWMPKYRYGTITDISEDICDVTLEACSDGGYDLNHKTSFSNVDIEYMGGANGEPFKIGDEVLIQLDDWDSPLVVGFKIPRRANPLLTLTVSYAGKDDYVTVWESALNLASETIPLNAGGFATFPCQKSLISDWIDQRKDISNDLWTTTEKGFDADWENYECEPEMNDVCNKETFHENDCPGINGEVLEDYIKYQRSKTTTVWGNRYDDFIYWIPNEIKAYLPGIDENFNFNSTKIQAINGSGYTGSMLIYLYHLYYKYFIYSYGNSWTNYFDSKKYTIKTPIGNFELIETDSFIFDNGDPEYKSDNHLDPLYGNLVGKYSKSLFSQIYWIQYKYSGDTETDRTISVIAQSKVVEDATIISPNNALGRDTELETSIANLINAWYNNNSYIDRDIVDCSLSMQLVV